MMVSDFLEQSVILRPIATSFVWLKVQRVVWNYKTTALKSNNAERLPTGVYLTTP